MRSFAAMIDRARMRDPGIPDARRMRAKPGQLHRLDDGIAELFDYACLTGDLECATDLVMLMEKWLPRHEAEPDLRDTTAAKLKQMRAELVHRYVRKGIRPPNNEAWMRDATG